MYESSLTTGAVLIGFWIASAGLMFILISNMECYHVHGLLMMGGVMVTGTAILVFRLFRGYQTRVVKYIHMGFHLIAMGLYVGGYFPMSDVREKWHVHGFACYISFGAYVIQFLLGMFLFTYLYEYRAVRLSFAPFHDIFGVWLYINLVGGIISGNHSPNSNEFRYLWYTKCFNVCAYISYMSVVFTALTPYFEWELVGDL